MNDSAISETTQLLRDWAAGQERALSKLAPRVYRELKRVAGRLLQNERRGHSLQPSDLVHEAYLRLVDVPGLNWQHRAHFFAVAATMMRRILLDRARRRLSAKRAGKAKTISLEGLADKALQQSSELIALDDALCTLAQVDPRKARVVELRFFVGLGVKETAEVIGVSAETVMRDWKMARAWLLAEMSRGERQKV